MRPRLKLEFIITSTTLTSERITELLGTQPSRTWDLGDAIERTALRRKHNGWCLLAPFEGEELDLSIPTRSLLHLLTPIASRIRKLSNDFEVYCVFSYAVYLYDETPIVHFAPEVLSEIANLNAHVDIDLILLPVPKDQG
jgi:hypothetical protein